MNRIYHFSAIALCAALLSSCSTHSHRSRHRIQLEDNGASLHPDELNEFDVLGGSSANAQVGSSTPVTIKQGDCVLVIQSGALRPDEAMLAELTKYFKVASFSGIPAHGNDSSLAQRLRTAALNGGCSCVFVYWSVLETARRDLPTKTLSWIPLVGQVVPDKAQRVRIQPKGYLLDAATGRWSMYVADSFEDERMSAAIERESAYQNQVARLKARAYENLVTKLVGINEVQDISKVPEAAKMPGEGSFVVTGKIVFNNLEGGYYGIITEDGQRYDPDGLPPEYRRDGLRIKARIKIRDVASIHLWGHAVEIVEIKELDSQPSSPAVQRDDEGKPLGVADVKALAEAGLSDEVILSHIRNSEAVYHLTAAEIIDLKNSGVSEKVIDFMINTASAHR